MQKFYKKNQTSVNTLIRESVA